MRLSLSCSAAGLLFHEPWWLAAVTGGHYQEAIVEQGGNIVGRLPYVTSKRGPFRIARMPRFTHVLGPWVYTGMGKSQTRLINRLSITRALIDKLPRLAFFEQHLDPSEDDGFASADGLAFQDRGFSVSTQYTFQINCAVSAEALWEAMHGKTRNIVRRAQEQYVVGEVEDGQIFADTYTRNLYTKGQRNRIDLEYFPGLFAQCRAHACGEIVAAFSSAAVPVAMIFLVWGARTMYYVLSTRTPDPSHHGAVNLLIWEAMQRARGRGLVFDLDGVYNSGSAHFLGRFGGRIRTRLAVRRGNLLFSTLQRAKLRYSNNQSQIYT